MNHNLIAVVNIGDATPLGGDNGSLSRYTSLSQILSPLLRNSLTLAGIIFVILIVAGGLGMILGAGNNDPKKAEASKKTLTSAITGFIIVFSAYLIIQLIEVLTGLNILNPTLE